MGHTLFTFNFSVKIQTENYASTLILLAQNRPYDAIPAKGRGKKPVLFRQVKAATDGAT